MTVRNRWYGETNGHIGVVPFGLLFAVVQLTRNIPGVVCMQHCGPVHVRFHVFRILKRVFGFDKTGYRGLAKNHNRLCANFALVNLYLHRKRLVLLGA